MPPQRKRVLHELTLDKIAAVDSPCQEHALAMITKRNYTEDQRKEMSDKGWALPDGSYPIADVADLKNAVSAFGRAKEKGNAKGHIIARAKALDAAAELPEDWSVSKSLVIRSDLEKLDLPGARGFSELLAENEAREKCWAAESAMWPLFDALRQSLSSIAADQSLDPASKLSRVQESVNEFVGSLQSEWPDVAEEVDEIAKASPNSDRMALFINAGLAGPTLEKGTPMSDAIKKALGLDASATEADIVKAIEAAKTADTVLKAELETLKGKMPAALADAMEDDKGKPTKKGAEFIDKHRPVIEGGDEILKVGDKSIKKSVVGVETFEFMKAQQADIAKERDERVTAQMEKRVGDELPSLPGTVAEKAKVLKALVDVPEDVRKAAEAMLTAGEKAIKGAFTTQGVGSGGRDPVAKSTEGSLAKARVDFMAKVNEIKTRDKCSKTDAMQKAQTEHPELFKMYREADQIPVADAA